MSKIDHYFIENCKDIIENGYDNSQEDVRPRWADGTPAYSKKKFGIVNHYDLREEFLASTIQMCIRDRIGTIRFKRRYYRHKKTAEYVYLLDRMLQLEPRERIDKGLSLIHI